MLDIQNFIGKTSTEADRKKQYRRRIESEKNMLSTGKGQMSGQMSGQCPLEIEIDIEKDIEKNIKKDNEEVKTSTLTKKFISPTVEEVREYCNERNNNVNPQAFIDFYESKGWYIGKNKMKNWKAAVRTWERKEQGTTAKKQSTFNAHI